jgi:hypothetical protein
MQPAGSAPRQRTTPAAPAQSSAAGQPIIVSCQCGKQLRAQPHLAGKTVKCPACAQALQIPSSRRAAAASPAPQVVQLEAAPESPPGNNDPWGDLLGDVPAATAPAPQLPSMSGSMNPYMAPQMAPQKPARASKPKGETDGKAIGAIVGGIAMIVGAIVWFVGGLFFDIIFFYPPILAIFGVISLIGGIVQLFRK